MTALLILSNQKNTFSELVNVLHDYYIVHFADSVTKISDILVDGTISTVIIDAEFLESNDQNEIIDILSFFPELTLVAAVESAGNINHVNLFQKFDVYRYFQKPFSADQVLSCINAATRKQSKYIKDATTIPIDNDFTEYKQYSNLIIISIAVVLLASITYIILPSDSKLDSYNVSLPITVEELIDNIPEATNDSDLLTIGTEFINLSAKTGLLTSASNNQIDLLLSRADEAFKDKRYYKPIINNALHYYLSAYNLESDNVAVIDEFNKLNTIINERVSSHLSNKKYQDAISVVEYIKNTYPDYSETNKLELLLIEKGNELLSDSYTLSANKKYKSALNKISNAAILLPNKSDDLESAKNSINLLIQKVKSSNKLTSIIHNRLDSGSILYPENDSVKFYLNKLSKEDPENPDRSLLENKYAVELLNQTNVAIQYNKFEQAKLLIEEAKLANLQNNEVSIIENKLKKQMDTNHLRILASNAIESNHLLYPKESSAKYYLQTALMIEPENKKTISQIEALISLLLIQIETDIFENTLASASTKLKMAKEFGIKQEEIALLESRLITAINKR